MKKTGRSEIIAIVNKYEELEKNGQLRLFEDEKEKVPSIEEIHKITEKVSMPLSKILSEERDCE